MKYYKSKKVLLTIISIIAWIMTAIALVLSLMNKIETYDALVWLLFASTTTNELEILDLKEQVLKLQVSKEKHIDDSIL